LRNVFYEWLLANYATEVYGTRINGNRLCDLANDVKYDEEFPKRSKNRKYIRAYLQRQGAVDACMDCFEEAFDIYES